MRHRTKQAFFIFGAVGLTVITAELCSLIFFTVFKDNFSFFDIDRLALDDQGIRLARQGYHTQRGWDNHYPTPFGERPRAVDHNDPYIATFGDSFVHCDDAADHETWQEYLAARLKRDVFNFGTGGYGTDQSYLKYLDKREAVKTAVVILGLTTENICRIVNVYRPLYYAKTGQHVTKPRFDIQAGKLKLRPNPIPDESDLDKLRDPQFIRELGRHDYWFNRDKFPVLGFPYTKILFNKHLWHEAASRTDDIEPRPWIDLWGVDEPRELMYRIIDGFMSDARTAGARPILMLIPNPTQVLFKLEQGKDSGNTSRIKAYCRENDYLYFNPIDGFVAHLRKGYPITDLYQNHITARGNRIIAEELFNFLEGLHEQEQD